MSDSENTNTTPQNNPSPDNGLVTNDVPLAQRIERYRNDITGRNFEAWHRNFEARRNLEEGYGTSRNNPASAPDDNRHSPSSLLQCHRKIYYRSKNAPREYPMPHGVFIMGHFIEEEVVEPWLRERVIAEDEFIGNAGHVDFTEDTESGQSLRFGGSHDPTITDVQGHTLALTEVKSTGSDPHWIDKIKDHHKAQAHAYMKGLKQKDDPLTEYPPAFVIYVQKESLEVFPFFLEFDEDFWQNTVVDWAEQNSGYRVNNILPDSTPYMGQDENHTKNSTFECDYCDYRNRCGNYNKRDKEHKYDDTLPTNGSGVVTETFHDQVKKGFLPLKVYPEDAVVGHALAYTDVKLTPTIAANYPEMVNNPSARLKSRIADRNQETTMKKKFGSIPKRDVHDWVCPDCDTTYDFEEFDWWEGDVDNAPYCDHCQETNDDYVSLRGPVPNETHK